jgi:hypothetical protein
VNVFSTTGGNTVATTGSNTFTGVTTFSDTTNSTNYLNGAVTIAGGMSVQKDIRVSGSMTINGLLTVVSMSSQYVTSSQYNIGVSKVTVNDDDNVRFAGLSVFDSGSSSPATASIFWDSLQHRFIYENLSGSSYNSALLIAGPKNTGSLGSETGLTGGYLPYATGDDHIDNSVMYQSGSNIGIGTTSPGSNKLYVNGASYFADTVNFGAGTNSLVSWTTGYSDGTTLIIRGPDAGSLILQPNTSYTGIFIKSNGNVGIGTTSPGASLHVEKASSDNIIAAIGQTGYEGVLYLSGAGSGKDTSIVIGNGKDLNFKATATATPTASGTTVMTLGANSYLTLNGAANDGRIQFSNTARATASGLWVGVDSTQSYVLSRGSYPLTFYTDATERVRITSAGNVGIGTTSPGVRLDVQGVIASRFSTFVYSTIDGTTDGNLYVTANAGTANTTASNIIFRSSTSGGAITERMRIDSSGNVGIGTTSPATQLHVKASGNYGAITSDNSTTTGGGAFGVRKNGTIIGYLLNKGGVYGDTTDDLALYAETGYNVRIYTNGSATEKFIVTTGGNVGIGTTSPAARLTAVGATTIIGAANCSARFSDDSGSTLLISHPSGNNNTAIIVGNLQLGFATSDGTTTTERVRITSGGKVGIGTTNPDDKFQVNGGNIRVSANTTSGTFLDIVPSGTQSDGIALSTSFYGSGAYGPLRINTGGAETMRLTGGNNVGIGTTDPGSYKLRVQGDQYISGTLTEASSIVLKENINPITDALSIISNLTGYTYDRKDGTAKNQAGLIAEEVEHTLPNVVSYDSEGNPSGVQYTKIIAYLVESIKELKKELDSLRR